MFGFTRPSLYAAHQKRISVVSEASEWTIGAPIGAVHVTATEFLPFSTNTCFVQRINGTASLYNAAKTVWCTLSPADAAFGPDFCVSFDGEQLFCAESGCTKISFFDNCIVVSRDTSFVHLAIVPSKTDPLAWPSGATLMCSSVKPAQWMQSPVGQVVLDFSNDGFLVAADRASTSCVYAVTTGKQEGKRVYYVDAIKFALAFGTDAGTPMGINAVRDTPTDLLVERGDGMKFVLDKREAWKV